MKKIYLAVPYSGMEESSFEQVTRVMGKLLMAKDSHGHPKYNVFSPITHCHPLTKIEGIKLPGTWSYWEKIDRQFVEWAEELIVLIPKEGIETVQNSEGVLAEMALAREGQKLIYFVQENKDGDLIFL